MRKLGETGRQGVLSNPHRCYYESGENILLIFLV